MKLIVYGKTNWGKDFPSILEDRMEAKKYASSFHSALRHIEIPMDLTMMSLPEWIDKIWDLATGMVVLPPTFLVTSGVVQSPVLPKLEKVSGVRACRLCLHPHTACGCSQVPSWSHASTRQSPAIVTMAHLHPSTSMSASTKCTPPGLPPLGGTMAQSTLTSGTYSEAVTFVPSPQTCMRWVSCPPLPGGGYPAVDLCLGAHSFRMEAPVRSEHPITLWNELRTPYQQLVQVRPILTTQSSVVSRGALLDLMRERSKELEQQMATPPTLGRGQGHPTSSKVVGAIPKKHEDALDQGQQKQLRGRSRSHNR